MAKINNLNFGHVFKVSMLGLLLVTGCAQPYKLMQGFREHKDQIRTIAIYPLYYTDKGEEAYLFGPVFTQAFLDSAKTMSLVRPIEFIHPDSVISLLRAAGVPSIADTDIVKITSSYPDVTAYRLPKSISTAISERADGLLFCNLITYNEVTFGKAFAQGMLTACLTLGMVSVMETPIVRMNISLIETTTGNTIWVYEDKIEVTAARSLESQRIAMTKEIIEGMQKSFPFSKKFEVTK